MTVPLPVNTNIVALAETALIEGFPAGGARLRFLAEVRPAAMLADWTAASCLVAVMEADPIGSDAEAILGRAEVRLVADGWDRARVRTWLEDVRSVAAAHARYGAEA